jgi:hypothetical protein
MNTYSENLTKVKDILGSYDAIGRACGVSGKAVMKWHKKGKPPRTEYTGETSYADILEKECSGAVKKEGLLPSFSQVAA